MNCCYSSISSLIFIILIVHLISISSLAYPVDQDVDHQHGPSTDQDLSSTMGYSLNSSEDDSITITTIVPPENEMLGSEEWPSSSYYHRRCPNKNVEQIIYRKVKEWVDKDYTIAPSLLRLHFHDCAVRGCDASILLDYEESERRADVSKTLRAFEVIDDIKTEIEKECPKTVSCADILTAAARDATVLLGAKYWTVPFGRKDGRVSIAKEADAIVPRGHENTTTLLELFQSMGLDVSDLVILEGAHTIGRSSCREVQKRIYDHKGSGKPDGSIKKEYLNYLQRKCRWESEYVELDEETPWKFDTMYYKNLVNNMGLLSTDQLLIFDSRTKPIAKALASIPTSLYAHIFGASMTKLGSVGVLAGKDEGEIRTNCNFVNSYIY